MRTSKDESTTKDKNNLNSRMLRFHKHFDKLNKKKQGLRFNGNSCLAAIIVIAVVACGGATIDHYHHAGAHHTSAVQSTNSGNVICEVRATPNSVIYNDSNEVGKADKNGMYSIDATVGSKLQAKFGRNMSRPLVLTHADNHKKLQFAFNYLNATQAESKLRKLYQCETNLANHNNQISGESSLDDFFVDGTKSDAYRTMFSWGKEQYQEIQKTRVNEHQHKAKPNNLGAVHFITRVRNTTLNANGTVLVNYSVKCDKAYPQKDKITTSAGQVLFTNVNGNWKISRITEDMY